MKVSRSAMPADYAAISPEPLHVQFVVAALESANPQALKAGLNAMLTAGFDPSTIQVERYGADRNNSDRVDLLTKALYYSKAPRILTRAIVESGINAGGFVNHCIVNDTDAKCNERWCWKLILRSLSKAARWAAHPLLDMPLKGLSASQSILDPQDPTHVGSALHQAVMADQIALLPELLKVMGKPSAKSTPADSFSLSDAVLSRAGIRGNRLDWHGFLQVLGDDDLLTVIQRPTEVPTMGMLPLKTLQPRTLLDYALVQAQGTSAHVDDDALNVIVDRLGISLGPLLTQRHFVRRPTMKAPVFDRIADLMHHHTVIVPRALALQAQPQVTPTSRPRPRS